MLRKGLAGFVPAVLCVACSFAHAEDAVVRKFAFSGQMPADKVYTAVPPDVTYDAAKGYGFEPGAKIRRDGPGGDSFTTADSSYFFSVRATDGNYRVTVRLAPGAELAVKAESRRIMTPLIHAPADKIGQAQFVVHVRQPKIDGTKSVNLNDREKAPNVRHWDDKLTLEFVGKRPEIVGIEIEKINDAVTVFLAGDSTVCDQPGEPWASWGQLLPMYFGPDVAVANYAESGRSMRSFRGDRRWDKILGLIKPGDYVMVQFGHNDMKEKGTGVGPYESFADSLRWAIKAVQDKGGHPVLLTPMHRRRFAGNEIQPTFGDYPDAIRKVAAEQGVPLIDLQTMSKPLFEAFGPEKSKQLFVHYPADTFPNQKTALKDDTHFNVFGADEIARCVIQGLRDLKSPLAEKLVPNIPAFDPTHPDDPAKFDIPASTPAELVKPAGS